MKFDGPRHTYPAVNAMVQAQAADRAGLVGHTEVDGDLTDLGADAGFKITKPVERKLEGFARRLRLLGNHKGSTNVGADRYEIQVDRAGFTLLSVNGKPNPCLDEPRRLCEHDFYADACPHCAQAKYAKEKA